MVRRSNSQRGYLWNKVHSNTILLFDSVVPVLMTYLYYFDTISSKSSGVAASKVLILNFYMYLDVLLEIQ